MIKRTIEISNPARLSLKNQQMVVEREGFEPETVPIEDMGVLILNHPAISYTQGLLIACSENNVAMILCDRKHLPCAIVLPLESNNLHTRTIAEQIKITEPTRKRLWQVIIQAKIRAQAQVLQLATGDNRPLPAYAKKVRSGDPENIEAQAAYIYWLKLFGHTFRRDPNGSGINSLLNYGYAVMRSAVARAIVSTGLHPSLGLHHHNQYNSFCLADDLIEPLRPVVDLKVYMLCKTPMVNPTPPSTFSPLERGDGGVFTINGKLVYTLRKSTSNGQDATELTTGIKRSLLEILSQTCIVSGRSLPLMTALHYYASSVREAICGEEKQVEIPVMPEAPSRGGCPPLFGRTDSLR
ncbi:MAG TPA: type II CRISPR-associated endonuclease Cas1 [Candidatus Brocadiia bacterium]|nr:type II CRISPR-associated endonuclease Cas1 [Planctomycetota bacterium]MDO8093738.1 type II CRISPR-associated endonuclease Cas1 [Candidatus Brocadiales bacterium]